MAGSTLPVLLLAVAVAVASTAAGSSGAVSAGTTTTTTSNTNNATSPTAYEMLERYDFPRGILPEGVTGYELAPDGAFAVHLPHACEFLLSRTWLVRYDARVTGAAAAGRLTALRGVSVKVLFLWVPVGEVDRDGDQLSFYVGPVATSFPIADFKDSPHCRGYDDDDGEAAASAR